MKRWKVEVVQVRRATLIIENDSMEDRDSIAIGRAYTDKIAWEYDAPHIGNLSEIRDTA